jgi:OOP family OmpA-OmpF porin
MTSTRTSVRSGAVALALLAAGCQTAPSRVADAPPPPPSMAAAAPTPALVRAPGPWGVYFDFGRDQLRPEAIAILDMAVDAYRATGRSVVTVTGHGDTVGRTPYNVDLGERRADAVSEYLVSKGVDRRNLRTQTRGERDQMVPTPDDVRERRNRRVEIRFDPA